MQPSAVNPVILMFHGFYCKTITFTMAIEEAVYSLIQMWQDTVTVLTGPSWILGIERLMVWGRKMSQGLVHFGVRDHGGQDQSQNNAAVKEGKADPAFTASHPQYENHIGAFLFAFLGYSVCF